MESRERAGGKANGEKRAVALAVMGPEGERTVCEAVVTGEKVILNAGQAEALFDWAAEELKERGCGGFEIEVVETDGGGREGAEAPDGAAGGKTRKGRAGKGASLSRENPGGFDEVVVIVEGEEWGNEK
ncbi:MAG: hypothetical protein FWC55_08205 [Firmicutes bacterium]|nr:hypothetical protein [Bacillota bacterium]